MNRLPVVLAMLLPFLFSCGVEKQAEGTPESSLLWKIEKEGMTTDAYLYGTMHLINKEYFYFPEKLQNLVKKSDVLVMELGALPDYASAMSLMLLPEGESINDYFTEEQMELVYDFMESEMNMNKEAFDLAFGRMKPFIILQLVTSKQFSGETESFELSFTNLAKENEIEIIGLETVEQQLGFFDQIPQSGMGSMITQYFEEKDKMEEETEKLQKIYRAGNLDSLAVFMKETSQELLDFEDILLTNRNKAWIPEIEKIISEKNAFIAVGAAHLAGENGVIELLKKKGYTVQPILF